MTVEVFLLNLIGRLIIKDNMRLNLNNINKKAVIFFSLLGFVLSLLSGIITGHSIINLFFRSIVSGLLMGILISAVNLVIMMYLPELLEPEGQEDVDDDDSRVDIVMPQEEYRVQSGDEGDDIEQEVTDDGSETSPNDSAFKEVDLDNLKSLSSSDSDNTRESEAYEDSGDYSENAPSAPSSKVDTSDFGGNSTEDMAKAVKTVLKRD